MNIEAFGRGRLQLRRLGALPDRRRAQRLVAQEYIPFAAWLISWAALGAAVGLSNVIWLMAANGFVQAIRSMFLAQSFDAVSARIHASREMKSQARRLALRVDVSVLGACTTLLLMLASGFHMIELGDLATMMLIMALGLPARTPALLAVDRNGISTAWRLGSAATMVIGAGMVALLQLHWGWGALVLAMREWGGLVGVALSRRAKAVGNAPEATELGFAEIASRTSLAARRRLVYRIGKIALSVLGPAGTIIARTSRGSGLDGRLARKISVSWFAVGLLAVACSTSAAVMIGTSREAAILLIASVLARVAGAAAGVLIWWRWKGGEDDPDWLNEDL